MLTYEKIKSYFDRGLWTAEMVANAVVKEKISAEEYKQITGLDYVAA